MPDSPTTAREWMRRLPVGDDLRHKLIADLFELPVWHQGSARVVTPPWKTLTVAECDLIRDALRQWRAG